MLVFVAFGASAQFKPTHGHVNIKQLPKDWLLKVDPLSAVFHEFRMAFEIKWNDRTKLTDRTYFYIAPSIIRRNSVKAMQRHFGGSIRGGARMYFMTDYAPMGLFAQLAGAYQVVGVQTVDENLQISEKYFFHSPGGNVAVGYQWMYGTKMNFVYGFVAGAEFFYRIVKEGHSKDELMRGWYQMPFLPELRIYAGVEIGFGFRQKARHW